ncbi:hypothetical protein JD969_20165 [Planctomycetota bacterium]|nr:hypothetical protein JD969_20165 [Planctomycetota bacterium]
MTKQTNWYWPALIFAFIALVFASLTFANQTSIIPINSESSLALISNITIVATSLPIILFIFASALGFGTLLNKLLLKNLLTPTLSTTLGLGLIAIITYILAAFALLTQLSAAIFLVLGLIPLFFFRPNKTHFPNFLSLLSAPAIGILLVAAVGPPTTLWQVEAFGYDVTSYHLQIPREWLALGQMQGLTHNVYSYLPSLGESLYFLISTLNNSVTESIYTIQLFHASFAILTAVLLAQAIRPYTGRLYALLAPAFFLTIPWTLITASLAYNEMFMTAFAAAAITLTLQNKDRTRSSNILIGFFLGLATLAKPTAGFFFAIPIGLIILIPYLQPTSQITFKASIKAAIIVALAGFLTLCPYLIRNYAWTGNPVFPFATSSFPAHWAQVAYDIDTTPESGDALGTFSNNLTSTSPNLAKRWKRGHDITMSSESYFNALNRQFLTNRGYGSWSGSPTPPEKNNIARFTVENGIPILSITLLVAAIFALSSKNTRRPTITLLFLLFFQFLFWSFGTHLQSRFLIPTLLPIALIIAIGFARFYHLTHKRVAYLAPLTASFLILMLFATQAMTLWAQTTKIKNNAGRPTNVPPYYITGYFDFSSNNPELQPNHPLNNLPTDAHVLLIADNASLLYIKPEFTYNTAFDANPLGNIIRQYPNNATQVTKALKNIGITHVYVHHSEMKRLQETYGFDPAVSEQSIQQIAKLAHWKRIPTPNHSNVYTLYKLP